MNRIYIYTTPTYRTKNWYKVGETMGDPIKRIKEQDNASNPEPLIFIASWLVPKNLTDKKIHSELIRLGFDSIRNSREWFELSDTPETDIEMAISKFTTSWCNSENALSENHYLFKNHKIPHYSEIWWSK